jgi:hypothetical protein
LLTVSQSKALELLWKGMGYADGDSDPKKPEGKVEPKPQIYRAAWMRKPGDPDYEEDVSELLPIPLSLTSIYLFDVRLADLHLFESPNNSASSTTCESNDKKLQALHEHPS